MNHRVRARLQEWAVTAPPLFWLIGFFLAPTLLIVAVAFKPANPFGGVGEGWTLDTLRSLGNPDYPAIVGRTLWLSTATTVLCLLLALPAGYVIARAALRWRRLLLMLVIVPFWTSFLIRIFAWKVLLHPEGAIQRTLAFLGLIAPDAILLYNPGAVLLVMVYTFLPFAILPIYAAAEKFDFTLTEAARDLGASRFQALIRVFVPGISRGLWTAALVVFIPALGSYVIPDLVGGPGGEMIGNKIVQRVFVDRNVPHAAALSALLMLAVLAPTLGVLALQARRRTPEAIIEEDA
jgi:spermidine/putrescine transport system permease protein